MELQYPGKDSMNKYIFLIIINILIIQSVHGELVASPSNQYVHSLNMTERANNIFDEIIIIVPKEALTNVHSINAIQFWCTKTANDYPNQNFVIRFFKYYGLGVFEPIDNTYITPSQCFDFAYSINWNLYNIEIIDHNYDYAIGMYSNSVTSGSWQQQFINSSDINTFNLSLYSHSWNNITTQTPIINVSIVDMNGLQYYYQGDDVIQIAGIKLYGTLESITPPTPTPIPTTAPLNNSDEIGLNNLHNLSNNPQRVSSISIGNNNTVGSIVAEIESISLGFTVFGMMIFIIRFFSIKKEVN